MCALPPSSCGIFVPEGSSLKEEGLEQVTDVSEACAGAVLGHQSELKIAPSLPAPGAPVIAAHTPFRFSVRSWKAHPLYLALSMAGAAFTLTKRALSKCQVCARACAGVVVWKLAKVSGSFGLLPLPCSQKKISMFICSSLVIFRFPRVMH